MLSELRLPDPLAPTSLTTIDVSAMPDRQNQYHQRSVLHLINDPVITHSDSIEIRRVRELHATRWPRLLTQRVNRMAETTIEARILQLAQKLSACRLRNTEFSIQPRFHLGPRQRFVRLAEGIPRRLQISRIFERLELG